MLNPKIHRLVHNFHIFILPMASPELVYGKKSKITITRQIEDPNKPGSSGSNPMTMTSYQKLVRMDFGMINEQKADPHNKICFETNTALVLLQMMIRQTFVAVMDLQDGDENLLLYPYGYIPKKTDQRLLENIPTQASEGGEANSNSPNPSAAQGNPAPQNSGNSPNTLSFANNGVKDQPQNSENGESTEKPAWDSDDQDFWTGYDEKEEDDDESEDSQKLDPETESEKEDAEEEEKNPLGDLDEIKWDQMDENWDDISKTINKNFWTAYFNDDKTNEDFIFMKVVTFLSKIGAYDINPDMSRFISGNSLKFNSKNENGTHVFNMFIDFAYSGSFNKFNSNVSTCITDEGANYWNSGSSKNSSFRAFAISMVFKKPNPSSSNDISYGDEKSVRYRLFKSQPQNFTVHNSHRIGIEKFKFENSSSKPDNSWKAAGTEFENGQYGSSSRFIVMFFGFADIIQPVLSIDHISKGKDLKMVYHLSEEDENKNSKYLKYISGNLNMRIRIRGCLGGVDIWDMAGNQLKELSSSFDETMNETLVNLELPVDLMNNPFSEKRNSILVDHDQDKRPPSNFAVPVDAPRNRGNSIPLHLKINEKTNNLLAIKLNLKCTYYKEENKGLFGKLPQSHLVRGMIDPGYYSVNDWSKKLDYKTAPTVFQVNIQDISKIETNYMIQQKFLSNIDVITDFDLFFQFADRASAVAVAANDIKGDKVKFQTVELAQQVPPTFQSVMKLFTFDVDSQQINFERNLQEFSKNWDLQFKFFGDIGCCTTSTQGKTILHIMNKKKNGNLIPDNIYKLFSHRGFNGESMMVDVDDAKKSDPYGLIFYELIGGGVSLHYRGELPMHSDSLIHSYNRRLEETPAIPNPSDKKPDSVVIDVNKVSKASGYDMNNLFAFGYLYSKSPVTTPYAGLMCSDREKFYLQIVPLANPSHVDLHNDSIGNMLFQIQLFTPQRAEFEIDIEKVLGSKLYFKSKIDHEDKPIYLYTTTVNPHLVYSSLNKFVTEEKQADMEKSSLDTSESETEEKFLNNDQGKDFGDVNMWSLLSGRKILMRMTRKMSESLTMVDLSFSCLLRNKNPFYEEKYALMFKFNPVMKDNSYTSNKFIL